MTTEIEQNPVYPYPLRASTFIERPDALFAKEPIVLSEGERAELLDFENGLYESLREFKKIPTATHEIYPEALTSGKGKTILEIIYKQGGELQSWISTEAARASLDIRDDKLRKEVREAVFDDLFANGAPESGQEVVFARFAKIIETKTKQSVNIARSFKFDESRTNTTEVKQVFEGLDFKQVTLSWRDSISDFTEDWAKANFKDEFFVSRGDLSRVTNPERIFRQVDPDRCDARLAGFRELKKEAKRQIRELENNRDNLSEAKIIVLDIYRKYLNVQIAKDLSSFSSDLDNRERLERFVTGVGEEFENRKQGDAAVDRDEKNYRALLTKEMRTKVAEIEGSQVPEPKTEIDITSEEVVRLTNWLFLEYGFKDWKAKVRGTDKGSIGLNLQDKIINIPQDPNTNLPHLLAVLAHEVEGHILSHKNWDQVDLPLKIMKLYSAGGRDSVLAEAVGKKVERETRKKIDGFDDRPELNYFRGLLCRQDGGTFKDVVLIFLEDLAKKRGTTLEQAFADQTVFDKIFDPAYNNAMRLFRDHSPLNDTSGHLTTTEQLKYLEQEAVVEALENQGLGAILYMNGPDLYSVMDLIRLGAFDLGKLKQPEYFVAKKIWPLLRDGIAAGKTITQILNDAGVAPVPQTKGK